MPKVTGSFVFRDEGDGCLTCKYLNDDIQSPFTECCKIKSTPHHCDPFIGTFTTTWIEAIDEHEIATLNIRRGSGDFFELKWDVHGKATNPTFTGKAMLYHGLLIGHYISHP